MGPDAARGADDQHALSGLELRVVGQCTQRGQPGDTHRSGLLEGESPGLAAQLVLASDGELGERPSGDTEDLVADREPRHLAADRQDRAGDVEAGHPVLRTQQTEAQHSDQVGRAGHQVPGAAIHAGRAHLDQHLVGAGRRPVDRAELQRVGGAVLGLQDRAHGLPRRRREGLTGIVGGGRDGVGSHAGVVVRGRRRGN